LHSADAALYRAKAQGGRCCAVAGAEEAEKTVRDDEPAVA
jgi:GGDEF domain-containing protein